ncbi:MAG: ABC transporter ATP-binding protein [Anaerolineae bacterium]|jgi:ABC-type Fe3+/spermidine/putrescine transport system ATPase subunit|nr:ABC transporter ATP-binding protein [Anaerolineae bacterium]
MLSLHQVEHHYNGVPVLQAIDLALAAGEIMCLLGPSGCGKTTLLRVIAGLEEGSGGDVRLEGQSLAAVPAHQRGFGLMFQDYALFPHLTVAQNVAFGLRMQRLPAAQQPERIQAVLRLVGLAGFDGRDISTLSGGEKQRVALARSLAPQPRLLMLDEPLGALDALLRERLVVELRDIIRAAGLTALYVTHDRQEAFAIADRIAIMNDGRMEQLDTPEGLYMQPRTAFVARFLGLNNVLPVQALTPQGARTAAGTFAVAGAPPLVLLHPDAITLDEDGPLPGTVTERTFQGDHYRMQVQTDAGALRFRLSRAGVVPLVGQSVRLRCDRVIGLSG